MCATAKSRGCLCRQAAKRLACVVMPSYVAACQTRVCISTLHLLGVVVSALYSSVVLAKYLVTSPTLQKRSAGRRTRRSSTRSLDSRSLPCVTHAQHHGGDSASGTRVALCKSCSRSGLCTFTIVLENRWSLAVARAGNYSPAMSLFTRRITATHWVQTVPSRYFGSCLQRPTQ